MIFTTTWMEFESVMLSENKPDTENHVFSDSIYMKCPE